ncbi:hypothetical protein CDO44_03570 [Pigmentiphaga sp. NML080357]|nr:hypothetical protein CDO44_03570 [Pigmentiphaga sp. NML080357]
MACGFKALECGHGYLGELILARSSGMTSHSLPLLATGFPHEHIQRITMQVVINGTFACQQHAGASGASQRRRQTVV